jgi:transcriptional regulator with XRE-family HTH domain
MKRENLLRSPNYWLAYIQNGLFGIIEDYMTKNNLKKVDLANELGVTKGYISQVLNGDFDHKISKLVELSLACGKVPTITYLDLNKFIEDDLENKFIEDVVSPKPIQYILSINSNEPYIVEKKTLDLVEKAISQKIPDEVTIETN